MTRKIKEDRITRAVEKEFNKWVKGPQIEGWLSIADTLLRREHAWMRRMVKTEPEFPGPMPEHMFEAMRNDKAFAEKAMRLTVRKTKENILTRLTQRRAKR